MNYLITLGISALMTLASAFGIYNYVPFGLFENQETSLGSSITTIAGSDTLKNSRTTINDNFSALNNGKIENSTTSVAAITTLSNLVTTGVLSSSTYRGSKIQPAYGGTGTSSPTGLLWGDGSNLFSVASGTSGHFLQSNGASAPAFAAAQTDQTAGYVWSGTHTFGSVVNLNATTNATGTMYIKNLNASSTSANPIVLNGVSYNTPSTQGASSTVLRTNGSGTLIWENIDGDNCGEQVLTSANSTSTVTVAARKDIYIVFSSAGRSDNDYATVQFNTDYAGGGTNYTVKPYNDYTAATSLYNNNDIEISPNYGTTTQSYFFMHINNTPTRAKLLTWEGVVNPGNPVKITGSGIWNNTADSITTISVIGNSRVGTWNTGTRLTAYCSKD